jgi:protein-S-isoprenylcysteine O-methyltransferase Ste14
MPITEAFSESLTAHPLYTWAVLGVVMLGIVSFFLLLFISAPYGRHVRPGWGPTLDARTLWVVMEAPSPICFAIVYFMSDNATAIIPSILFGMYMLHYVYRAFVYPFRMRGGHKPKPLLTGVLAFAFNTANGSTNAFAITELAPHLLRSSWLADPRFIVGVLVFATGYAINQHSDAILRNLRKPGESGYKIPYGGFYRWVSSPNYLGEIIEWTGFALAAWTVPAGVFAWFTAMNLVPRAFSNHRWYQEHFGDYPKNRRAIIPFLL